MANAFWGGFAESLKGYIDRDMEEKRMEEQEKRKMQFLQELEKWKQDNIIASSEFDPKTGEIVYFNGAGKEMSRRPASQAQIEAYQSDKKKTALSERQAEAQVGLAEFTLQNAPASFKSEQAARAANIRQSDAAASASSANARYMDALAKGEISRGGGRGAGGSGDGSGLPSMTPKQQVDSALEEIRIINAELNAVNEMNNQPIVQGPEREALVKRKKYLQSVLEKVGNRTTSVPLGRETSRVEPPSPAPLPFGEYKF